MRLNNNISFPHPILRFCNDDILPALNEDSCKFVKTENDFEYKFDVTLSFNNKEIRNLIGNGYAKYVCEIDCQKTFYRKCKSSDNGHFNISVSRKDVRGDVVSSCLVIAVKPIKNYSNENFNQDYDNQKFDLEPGDLLVAFPQKIYNVNIKYNELQSIKSFMQFRKDETGNRFTRFDISGDMIDIVLPVRLYDDYNQKISNERDFNAVIHSSVVFNALVYALLNINENESTLWAKTIFYRIGTEKDKFNNLDIDNDEDVLKIAQILLEDPYLRLFESLDHIKEQNTEDD